MVVAPHDPEAIAPTSPAPGEAIAGFELVAPLGRRRPARAWRAVERASGTIAVVKLAPAREAALLAREAAALRALELPGVPRLLADGHAAPTPYLARELVEGVALDEALAGGIAPPALARLLAALAAELGRLHEAGFIHGDVQPANVVLRPGGSPALIDFASARAWREPAAEPPLIELTPGYAAPECRRAGARIGPAADLYALGAIGYRALVGRAPLAGAPPLAEAARAGPFALRAVLDWALEADPDARPASADELRTALLGALEPGPATVRVRRLPTRLASPAPEDAAARAAPRRRLGRRLAAALLAAALLAPAAWLGAEAWRERTRLDWRVDPAGGGHARTIGEALARARSGATIRIAPGTYRESLEVARDVALVGDTAAGARPVIAPAAGSCVVARAVRLRLAALALRNEAAAPCLDLAGGVVAVDASEIASREGAAVVAREGVRLSLADSVVASSGAAGVMVAGGASALLAATALREAGGSGILARGGAELTLRDVTVEDTGQAGLLLAEGAAATLERVRIADTGRSGIELRGGARLAAREGAVERAGGAGLFLGEGARARLDGVRVAASRLSGILVGPAAEIEIAGGEIEGNGEHGLTVLSLGGATLRETQLAGNAGHAVALEAEARFEAAGPVLERNKEPQLLDERRHDAARQAPGR
jgi:hypothetical protein